MKSKFIALVACSAGALFAIGSVFAEPMPLPAPVQGHGGNGKGLAPGRGLNDLLMTQVTRVEMGYAKEVTSLNAARAKINQVAWTSPPNSPALMEAATAVANAELTLALKRAEAYQSLKASLKLTSSEDTQRLANALGAGGGRAGGGRAGAAPAAPAAAPAAPAARGN